MDLFNNEIITYSLLNKKVESNTYHFDLKNVSHKKEELFILILILLIIFLMKLINIFIILIMNVLNLP